MIGAGFAHAANLLIAIMLYEHGKSKTNKHDVDQVSDDTFLGLSL
jgi:hypothetical protein